MPSRNHYVEVARRLRQRVDGRAFTSITRREATELLREVSGEERTRIRALSAHELTTILLEHGIACYPALSEAEPKESVRLYHANSLTGKLVDIINHPTPEHDAELGSILLKIKGKWNWDNPVVATTEDGTTIRIEMKQNPKSAEKGLSRVA